jgi:hypothetical protein
LYDEAQLQGDNLLQGYALLIRARYLLIQEFDRYSQGTVLKYLRFHKEADFLEHIRLTLLGQERFQEAGYVELANQCLYCGIELIHVARHAYRYRDDFDLDQLETRAKRFEKENELEPYELQFPILSEKIARIGQKGLHGYLSETKDLDDLQLQGMADSITRAVGLSAGCYPNLLAELQNCRLFYQRADNQLELLPYNRDGDQRTVYRRPVRFVIRNKRTDIRSMPTSDLAALLNRWGV